MERSLLAVVFTLVCFAISPALGAENASDEHYKRGLALEDKGDHDKAIAEFNEAIRLDPQNAFAYKGRGVAWSKKGEFDRAMTDFDESLRINPKFADAYNAPWCCLGKQMRVRQGHHRVRQRSSVRSEVR